MAIAINSPFSSHQLDVIIELIWKRGIMTQTNPEQAVTYLHDAKESAKKALISLLSIPQVNFYQLKLRRNTLNALEAIEEALYSTEENSTL